MKTPTEAYETLKNKITARHRLAFVCTFFTGLMTHLPVMLSDIPNHDGLASMYFDQNMITSGRWFLTVACGFSSYFTVPWVIGLLGLFFLSLTACVLTEILELREKMSIFLISTLLAVFPSLASTFAYVFTLDGYMLALLLSALAVLLTKKYRRGFLPGALCMACSMGTYQAYLPFAILLCFYEVLSMAAFGRFAKDPKGSRIQTGKYLAMGVLGALFYFVILKVLLALAGKELASYQGIDSMNRVGGGMADTLLGMYHDFAAFTLKGNVLVQNLFSLVALTGLVLLTLAAVLRLCILGKWWKKPGFYLLCAALAAGLPLACNCILLVSPNVTYHLLMRYQWVLLPICMIAFLEKARERDEGSTWLRAAGGWITLACTLVLIFCYLLTDNIAYSNLEKRYEKTYAYCIRLLDRIEQTEGYYPGIPVAMIGVVSDEQFPQTDLTGKVTAGMIGLNGDSLLYTAENYDQFIRNYLGATLNMMDSRIMIEIYNTPEYLEMGSFPCEGSTRVIDGVLYIKTENQHRAEEE